MSFPSMDDASSRSSKLARYLHHVCTGKQAIRSITNSNMFLEALCDRTDQSSCIEKLCASANGVQALHASFRLDISPTFINGRASEFLKYIQDPALEIFCNGHLIRQVVIQIVEPPTFWNAIIQAHEQHMLDQSALQCLAWLLVQLLSLPNDQSAVYQAIAEKVTKDKSFLDSPLLLTRSLGQKIKHILSTIASPTSNHDSNGPGGRHDNDFVDFRQIAILPTPDELACDEDSFLRRAEDVMDANAEERVAIHLDNQFRLLHEEMSNEVREDVRSALGKQKGFRRSIAVDGLSLLGVDCGQDTRRKPCGLTFRCTKDIAQLSRMKPEDRKIYIKENRNLLRHQSIGCLVVGDQILSLALIDRNENLLAAIPPVVVLQFSGEAAYVKTLMAAKTYSHLRLVQVDTPLFAYEPILRRLQEKKDLQLTDELMFMNQTTYEVSARLTDVVERIKANSDLDLQDTLNTPRSIRLDPSQMESFVAGLTQRVSLIQGPPGTGKSFIGAMLSKVLHDSYLGNILVICFTNHALDQFLEDLLDIGIPAASMVRLGSKSTPRTKCLTLREQSNTYNLSRDSWTIINKVKIEVNEIERRLSSAIAAFRDVTISKAALLEHIEFSDDDDMFLIAFTIPELEDGIKVVGRHGKVVDEYYLLNRWISNQDAGIFLTNIIEPCKQIWQISNPERQAKLAKWKQDILQEEVRDICSIAKLYEEQQNHLNDMFNERNAQLITSKRIVACTTTAAAMYSRELQASSPEIVLVEEAGEIMESHILTAMGPKTKKLILIGDHKQLRPKINNFRLSVERGDGYDLNRSLFERLVLGGLPHTTLSEQHRMCPEISSLIRHLTYPALVDAQSTLHRASLRGFQDRLIFVNHDHHELKAANLIDRREWDSKASKQNEFEVNMVLKCVRYIAQQGYGTDKIVILTPYLGQLQLLKQSLSKEHDPVLNDLDSYDLVRAGLLPAATAKLNKRPIRISTIDNYQGEESQIVLVTLTRSNPNGDVGFMASPERLNVLISRARDALIMIGNAKTFLKSRKGKDIWAPLFDLLGGGGHIYDGFPVRCERHQDRSTVLCRPEDFERECPDGGCSQPCGTKLSCGVHYCPSRCHQLYDHSRMPCNQVCQEKCPQGHKLSWTCSKNRPIPCPTCKRESAARERSLQRAHELEVKRQARQQEYARQIADLDERIECQRQITRDNTHAREQERTLEQKRHDLAAAVSSTDHIQVLPLGVERTLSTQASTTSASSPLSGTYSVPLLQNSGVSAKETKSAAKQEWDHQKQYENVNNPHLNSLMEMIGLEDVKQKLLTIKAKVDIAIRQSTDLKDERFGVALLGNPGTGKTTVARLYARTLTSFGVLPGDTFVETTGSRLANEGINGAKKHIEKLLEAGGGALFIDEAYQLVSSHNHGGPVVLDFLLAEMENQTGKIVFILAGYDKEMEAFFEHNPGLKSRIPHRLQFADYEDDELLQIMSQYIISKYKARMKVEGGLGGLFLRIAARRVGRGRGRAGFGNARAIQNDFARIIGRQAERLRQERKGTSGADDFLFTKEDLIGLEPSNTLVNNKAWAKLQELVGLTSVKESVQSMLDRLQSNYVRELEEKPLIECSLNRVFLGAPGTGKTSVAKLYGQILADIGILSTGEVVLKNPSDFVGNVLGQSESKTRAILASSKGKVLIIDEAYMLYSQTGEAAGQNDIYKTAVIDTIVAEIQSVPGDDQCVLLLGYTDEMERMFQNVNPGLSRRFPMASAFIFEDFTDEELSKVFELKLRQQAFTVTGHAKQVAMSVLQRARNRPNFGNAGEVDILLDRAKATHQRRLSKKKTSDPDSLEAEDFDEDYDRGSRAVTNCRELFADVIGCENVVAKLEGYQQIALSMRERNLDPKEQIPFNFLFKGPPGTGKTTTARKMGKVYYDMGFLSTAKVEECSASDLVGQYVGHTGPRVRKILDKSLGRVLFVDEAYRLGEGQFATEAVNELVDSLTKPKYAGKLITILAGYDADIDKLMSINPGLTSRFPEAVIFENLGPAHLLRILDNALQKKKVDASVLETTTSALTQRLLEHLKALSKLPGWGNARDIETLARSIYGAILLTAPDPNVRLVLEGEVVVRSVEALLAERTNRLRNSQGLHLGSTTSALMATTNLLSSNTSAPAESSISTQLPEICHEITKGGPTCTGTTRDAGVSDEVWQTLEFDMSAAENASKEVEVALTRKAVLLQEAQTAEKERNAVLEIELLQEAKSFRDEEANEMKRKHEEARLQAQKARIAREQALVELEKAREAATEEKRKQALVQTKLRKMGVCVQGFQWIKQQSGYRCAGGSHFVGNEQLGL